MTARNLLVAKSAPAADINTSHLSPVHLDIGHWVSQSKLVDSRASDNTLRRFNDWQIVYQFLSIGQMGSSGCLGWGGGPVVLVELVFSDNGKLTEGCGLHDAHVTDRLLCYSFEHFYLLINNKQ